MPAYTIHDNQVAVIPAKGGRSVRLVKDPVSTHHITIQTYGERGGLLGSARVDVSDLRQALLLSGIATRRER